MPLTQAAIWPVAGLLATLALLLPLWLVWRRQRQQALLARRSRERAEHDKALSLALHDPLTHLPNRHSLRRDFALAVARAQRVDRPLDLFAVQLDMQATPQLQPHARAAVMALAQRMKALSRPGDLIARHGKHIFVLLRVRSPQDEEPAAWCHQLREQCGRPLLTDDGSLPLPLVIGHASHSPRHPGLQALLRLALRPASPAPPRSRRVRLLSFDGGGDEAANDAAARWQTAAARPPSPAATVRLVGGQAANPESGRQ